jgi:hypothetical protein
VYCIWVSLSPEYNLCIFLLLITDISSFRILIWQKKFFFSTSFRNGPVFAVVPYPICFVNFILALINIWDPLYPFIFFTFFWRYILVWNRGSSVSIVSDYGPGDRGSIPGGDKRIFPLISVPRPALGLTQPPVQFVPRVLSPGIKRGRSMTLTTHPHLVPRLWMSRSYTSSPPCSSLGVLWDFFTFCVLASLLRSIPSLLNFYFEHCSPLTSDDVFSFLSLLTFSDGWPFSSLKTY